MRGWLLVLTLGACGGEPDAQVSIAGEMPIATVSERFVSVAVDAAQLAGGTFWDREATMQIEGTRRVPPFDFARPRLRQLARALAPAYLRLGGTDADRLYYDFSDAPVDMPPAPYRFTLTRAQWDGAAEFARALGFEIVFTLNAGPGPRDADRRWQPEQARLLLRHASAAQHPIAVFELGNEVNAFPLLHGLMLSAAEYCADVAAARALLDAEWPGAKLSVPSSAYWPVIGEVNAVLPEVLQRSGASLDVVSWHYYPQQSRRCPAAVRRAAPEVMLDPDNLDEVDRWAAEVGSAAAAHASRAQLWLGETGNAQCGGEPGVSDAFAGAFWWADQLGLLARRGTQVVVRQTLSGSNYGLLDEDTLEPAPDYWLSVLWKRLMGTRVLDARAVSGDRLVRAYAHSTVGRPGAVTLLLLNLADGPRRVAIDVRGPMEVYLLTADALGAPRLRLNGELLAAAPDGTLPELIPESRSPGALDVPAHAIAFVVFPDADLDATR